MKKPYYITVDYAENVGISTIRLAGRNGFDLVSRSYNGRRVANQQAKRLAKALGVEIRSNVL